VLGLFLWVNACYLMGLFFLIAGLFTPGSVDRKGIGPFVRDRLRRLGIPLLFGFFVLLPALGWYAHLHNRHMGWVSYREYFVHLWLGIGPRPADWPSPSWPDGNFGHLWFLEHLLLYGLLYALWRRLRPHHRPAGGPPPSSTSIALYAVGLGVVSWAVRLWYPMNAWTGLLGFIQSEPAHLPQYASLFVIGVLAGRRGWFARLPAATGWRWLGIGVGAALFGCARAAATGSIAVNSLDTCLVEAIICTGLSVGLLVACRELWNGAGWVSALAPDTYAVYVFARVGAGRPSARAPLRAGRGSGEGCHRCARRDRPQLRVLPFRRASRAGGERGVLRSLGLRVALKANLRERRR
jgi:glucans biosynthesis protein C